MVVTTKSWRHLNGYIYVEQDTLLLLDLIREKRREEARKEKVEKIAKNLILYYGKSSKNNPVNSLVFPNGVGWGVSPRAKGPYTTILGQIPNPVFTHPPLSLHKLLCNVMDRSQCAAIRFWPDKSKLNFVMRNFGKRPIL